MSTIPDLVASLTGCTTAEEAFALVRSAQLSHSSIVKHVTYSSDGYTRVTLCSTPQFELVIVGWLPDQQSAMHNHGDSRCVMRVLHGKLEETKIDGRQLDHPALPDLSRCVLRKDDCTECFGASQFHRLRAISGTGASTLHLYAPPISTVELLPEDDAPAALGKGSIGPVMAGSA